MNSFQQHLNSFRLEREMSASCVQSALERIYRNRSRVGFEKVVGDNGQITDRLFETNEEIIMNKNSKISSQNLALTGAIVALAAVMGVVGFRVVTLVDKRLVNEAVQGCMEVGTEEYTNSEQESKAITYNRQAFEDCMEAKGYDTK
jgi:hypothetical protein